MEIEKGKKEINERGKIVILEIRIRTRAEFEELEIKRINKIKELHFY